MVEQTTKSLITDPISERIVFFSDYGEKSIAQSGTVALPGDKVVAATPPLPGPEVPAVSATTTNLVINV